MRIIPRDPSEKSKDALGKQSDFARHSETAVSSASGPDSERNPPPPTVETLYAPIRQFILRRVRSIHSAEELTQEAFLRLSAQIPPIAAAQVRAWLYRTARNLIVDAFRQTAVSRRAAEEIGYLHGKETDSDSRRELERKEENEMMIDLVNRLDDAHKEVVRLKFQEGLTYQEIAEVVDKPKTTVAWLLHESLLKLRNEMKVTQ